MTQDSRFIEAKCQNHILAEHLEGDKHFLNTFKPHTCTMMGCYHPLCMSGKWSNRQLNNVPCIRHLMDDSGRLNRHSLLHAAGSFSRGSILCQTKAHTTTSTRHTQQGILEEINGGCEEQFSLTYQAPCVYEINNENPFVKLKVSTFWV